MTDNTTAAPASSTKSTMVGGGVGVPASVIIVWLLETFAHVTVPGTIAAALGAVLASGVGALHSVRSK